MVFTCMVKILKLFKTLTIGYICENMKNKELTYLQLLLDTGQRHIKLPTLLIRDLSKTPL